MNNSKYIDIKSAVYEQFERLGKCLASGARLRLLDLLGQAPRTVEDLAGETGLSVANTSRHLKVLRDARLVATHKRGLYVTYRLAGEEVADFFRAFRELATARFAELRAVKDAYLSGRGAVEPADTAAALDRVRRGEATVLDVRPAVEYRAGHLPGAVSIPLDQLESRLDELPRSREIIAYCRGPYCVYAVEAVCILRAHGFRAGWIEDGVVDCRAHGLEVVSETTPPPSRAEAVGS